MYSALKVNGKKLYELARAGIEVERKALVRLLSTRFGLKRFRFRACGWKSPALKEPISAHCAMISERNSAVVAAWRNSLAQK